MTDQPTAPIIRTPVIVLTGFLGSGKTTLLNQILAQNATGSRRLAVIENEFGAISIDTALIIGADEDVVEMKNGCMCCTVRRDLINILSDLADKGQSYDAILIETTGLANPSPIAQTFMGVQKLWTHYELQGIVTVVDAVHIDLDLERHPVTQDQVAFANLLVLNKADLVSTADLDRLEIRLRAMNSESEVLHTSHGQIDSEWIFGLSGFDSSKGLRADPTFETPDYPYKWVGVYQFAAGEYNVALHASGTPHVSELVLITSISEANDELLDSILDQSMHQFFAKEERFASGELITPAPIVWQTDLSENQVAFRMSIANDGLYALFLQHVPETLSITPQDLSGQKAVVLTPLLRRSWESRYSEDSSITSVAIAAKGALDIDRLNDYFQFVRFNDAHEFLRMKGVLHVQGSDCRFIFQGVHTLAHGSYTEPWGETEPYNHFVIIGRNLNREQLTHTFLSCIA